MTAPGAVVVRLGRGGEAERQERRSRRCSPTARWRTTSPTSPDARQAAMQALEKAARSPATWTSGRSTRPFASVAINSSGISRSTRTTSRQRWRQQRSGHRSGALGARIVGAPGARAAPPGAAASLRRNLLGRRPGRRDPGRGQRGLAQGAPRVGSGTMAGAAFFDLDKTLMAAHPQVSHVSAEPARVRDSRAARQEWGWTTFATACGGPRTSRPAPCRGGQEGLRRGCRERDVERMAPAVLADPALASIPRCSNEPSPPGRRARRLHRQRRGNDLVRALAAVLGHGGGIGTGWAVRRTASTPARWTPLRLRRGQVKAKMQRFAKKHDIDMDASFAVLGLGERPADAAVCRQCGGGQSDADLLEIARQEGWRYAASRRLGGSSHRGATMLAAGRRRARRTGSRRTPQRQARRRFRLTSPVALLQFFISPHKGWGNAGQMSNSFCSSVPPAGDARRPGRGIGEQCQKSKPGIGDPPSKTGRRSIESARLAEVVGGAGARRGRPRAHRVDQSAFRRRPRAQPTAKASSPARDQQASDRDQVASDQRPGHLPIRKLDEHPNRKTGRSCHASWRSAQARVEGA